MPSATMVLVRKCLQSNSPPVMEAVLNCDSLFGRPKEEWIGRDATEGIHPADKENVVLPALKKLMTGSSAGADNLERRWDPVQKEWRVYRVVVSALPESGPGTLHLACTVL